MFFLNPAKDKKWLRRGQMTEPVIKQERFKHEGWFCVWWNFEDVLHWELVQDGRAVDANLYGEQPQWANDVQCDRYPTLVN